MSLCPLALYSRLCDDLDRRFGAGFSASCKADPLPAPPPDFDVDRASAFMILRSFLKKYQGESSDHADAKAVSKFLDVNRRCGSWSLDINTSLDEELVGTLKDELYKFFYPGGLPLISSLSEMLSHGRTGPGASIGARGNDFYTKLFSSPLSVTSSYLYDEYKRYISNFPEWANAESFRQAEFGECYIVEGSRLTLVPKNVDISRVICVEPNLNMFYQLGLAKILDSRLRRYFGIDLSTQPGNNRELSHIASITGSFSTIDLESASDSISVPMLRSILPENVFSWFNAIRSPVTSIDGEKVQLNMISSMGNGTTFSLQTIIFCCVVSAAYRSLGLAIDRPFGKSLGNFAVFGDDIICVSHATARVIRLLTLLGFRVNVDKSFVEGPFRESCGTDFFIGSNVRGVYIKDLSTVASRYVAINALVLWSSKTRIMLPRTINALQRSVPLRYVPPAENSDSGIKVPWRHVRHLAHRRNKNTGSVMYQCLESRPSYIRIGDSEIHTPRGVKSRRYNPSGLYLAFLNGSITSGKITVRLNSSRYRARWRVTPYWDYLPDCSDILSLSDWQHWESAASTSLY